MVSSSTQNYSSLKKSTLVNLQVLVKPSQIWSNLIKLGQTRCKLVLFGTGHYSEPSINSNKHLLKIITI